MWMDTMASEERITSQGNGPKYTLGGRWLWRASLIISKWIPLLRISKGTLEVNPSRNVVALIIKSGDRQLSAAELLID